MNYTHKQGQTGSDLGVLSHLQTETAAESAALFSAILDSAFKRDL